MREPDFYIASTDSYNVEEPRKAWCVKRISSSGRNDLLLAKVDPPISTGYGPSSRQTNVIILGTRHTGDSLFPINRWPISVHVAYPLINDVEGREKLKTSESENIAWAELYRTEEDARRKSS